jgi:hypothetical protein
VGFKQHDWVLDFFVRRSPVFQSIDPEKWYSPCEVAGMLRKSEDTIYRRIKAGKLQAFIMPSISSKRPRKYEAPSVLGAEIIRFIKANLTERK